MSSIEETLIKTQETINSLTTEQIKSVYRGKRGCCCGCSGIHRYNTKFPLEANWLKFNNSYVKKILNFIKENALKAEELWLGEDIVSITVDDIYYILYLADGINVGDLRLDRNREGEWIDFFAEKEREHEELMKRTEETLEHSRKLIEEWKKQNS